MDSSEQNPPLVYPAPIKKITIKAKPDEIVEAPGEFFLSESEELLKKAIVYDGITRDIIEGYNDAVLNQIPKSIKSSRIRILTSSIQQYYEENKLDYKKNKDIINELSKLEFRYRYKPEKELHLVFLDVKIDPPTDSEGRPLYQYHFLSQKKSYMATIMVRLGIEIKTNNSIKAKIIPLEKVENGSEWVSIGQIPILTGSILDNITKIPKHDWVKYGVNPADPQAKYIIMGEYYMIFLKDTLRLNRIFCYYRSDLEQCIMTNPSYIKTEPTALINDALGRVKYHIKDKQDVNIFTFARLVFKTTPDDLMAAIRLFAKAKHWRTIEQYLQISLEEDTNIPEPVLAIMTIMESDAGEDQDIIRKDKSKLQFLIIKYRSYFNEKLYPHVNIKDYTEADAMRIKINLLAIQIVRLCEFANGFRKADDRDSWANKSIFGSAVSVIQQFNGVWNNIKGTLEENINSAMAGKRVIDEGVYKNIFQESIKTLRSRKKTKTDIRASFEKNFLNNKWGMGNSQENGRTELIPEGESLLSMYSLVTKINAPVVELVGIHVKLPRADQLGYVGIVETPETGKCGLRRHKAVTCWISVDRDETILEHDIVNSPYFKSKTAGLSVDTVCMLNGSFLGWCNGAAMRKMIIKKRRRETIAKDISVVHDAHDNFLYIHTDRSRPTRPLLIVNSKNELIIDKKGLWGADFKTLLSEGAVEYVDSWELDFKDETVAKTIDLLRKHRESISNTRDHLIYLETEYLSQGGTLETVEKNIDYFQIKIDKLKGIVATLEQQHQKLVRENKQLELIKNKNVLELKKIRQEYDDLDHGDEDMITIQNKRKAIQDKIYLIGMKLLQTEYRIRSSADISKIIQEYEYGVEQQRASLERTLELNTNRVLGYKTKIKKYEKYGKIDEKEYVNDLINDYNTVLVEIEDITSKGMLVPRLFDDIISDLDEMIESNRDYILIYFDVDTRKHFYISMSKKLGLFIETLTQLKNKLEQENKILTKETPSKELTNTVARKGQIITRIDTILRFLKKKHDQWVALSPKKSIHSSNLDLADLKRHIELQREIYQRISKRVYNYAELNPNALFGVSASTLAAINLNEGVRSSYGASMNKQALGTTTVSDLFSFSESMKRLVHAQRPLYEPMINQIIGLDTAPNGENVKLAIMDWKNNLEDSIVLSKGAVDRGLFQMQVYKSYIEELKKQSDEGPGVEYFFGKPPLKKASSGVYDNIDERGIAMVGSIITLGQAIIAKYVVIKEEGKADVIEDLSIKATNISMTGMVDRAFLSKNVNGYPVAAVRIRTIRSPVVGDKFATRSAQKSVISQILPDTDMPFTDLGDVPDVIQNPLAIPSRMTVNQLVEMLASKHALFEGRRENATGFRKIDFEQFAAGLSEHGFNRGAYETFYDGATGEMIEGLVFFAPVYYRALKHHVIDKIQYRAFGAKDPMTRAPPGGRSVGGGLRLGEMEQAALIAHGADMVLLERMCVSSSQVYTGMCISCGKFAQRQKDLLKCRACGLTGLKGFGAIKIPFTFKLFMDHMAALGIDVRLKFKPVE